jgi:uncharacterized repeat protein (TIGR01451 family)
MKFANLLRRGPVLAALLLVSCQSLPNSELPIGAEPGGSVKAAAPTKRAAKSTTQKTGTAQASASKPPKKIAAAPEAPAGDAVMATDFQEPEEVSPRGEGLTKQQLDLAVEKLPHMPVEPQCYQGHPLPNCPQTPWAPPGIAGPWPHDEYLQDGGDEYVQVNLGAQGEIRGLELEDTVAIYDTKDGRTKICASNKVCLYAPRFAAVRQVTNLIENLQQDQPIGVAKPIMPHQGLEDAPATALVQPIRLQGSVVTRHPSIERRNETDAPAVSLLPVLGIEGGFAIYENLLVMKRGTFEESEKSRLLEAIDAAIVWTHNAAVQVTLDGKQAVDVTGDQRAQATYRYDEPNSPCLRIVKIASKKTAKPGEIVEFTLRFDNLGDQVIKKVVIVDNLTTRLEYVPTTAQSSRRADFTTETNEGDSLVLRWDFADPLPPGEGGLVRFHCKVR